MSADNFLDFQAISGMLATCSLQVVRLHTVGVVHGAHIVNIACHLQALLLVRSDAATFSVVLLA